MKKNNEKKKNLINKSLLKFKNKQEDINKIEIIPYPGKEFYLHKLEK